ncbi:hypothetical protein GR160_07850 [Flavobacterium sp. Sd200]|uniref:hypothetical protein n=1 Tax=Flavobacterium sp. Sd200 TaxID=2692211 RepID=UPI00136C1B37|nr:hypothetical protein [Flavobacterium sp. Sd200]MXN91142.1 hypothetical protein [Flavobacterium sp. Sd200]
MKNLHKLAFGLLVAVLAIDFSAFTNAPHKLVGNWYTINSSSGDVLPSDDEAQLFTSYDPDSSQENQPNCGGSINVCAAEFANGTGQPPTAFSLRN